MDKERGGGMSGRGRNWRRNARPNERLKSRATPDSPVHPSIPLSPHLAVILDPNAFSLPPPPRPWPAPLPCDSFFSSLSLSPPLPSARSPCRPISRPSYSLDCPHSTGLEIGCFRNTGCRLAHCGKFSSRVLFIICLQLSLLSFRTGSWSLPVNLVVCCGTMADRCFFACCRYLRQPGHPWAA